MGDSALRRLRDERSATLRSRSREWVLVEGHRLAIAALLLGVTYVAFLALASLDVVAFQNGATMTRLLGGTIAGVLSLITIVLAINQLVLNPELGNAGQTMERLSAARELQSEVEECGAVSVSPVEPIDFLAAIVAAIDSDVDAVAEAVPPGADDHDVVEGFLDHLREQTRRMDALLAETTFQDYDAILAAMHHETSWELFDVRRFWRDHADSLPPAAHDAFSDLLESLEAFQVAQNYFKTTYVQRELASVSRLLLFLGVPALFGVFTAGLIYGGPDGATIPEHLLAPVVAALIVVALSPLAVFAAYILRIATLIRRTPHVGPFTTERR